MKRPQIEQTYATVTADVRVDRRRPPDDYKRRAFVAGWRAATQRGRHYKDKTLESLTWQNLGNRFGWSVGDGESPDEVFAVLAELYQRRQRA